MRIRFNLNWNALPDIHIINLIFVNQFLKFWFLLKNRKIMIPKIQLFRK